MIQTEKIHLYFVCYKITFYLAQRVFIVIGTTRRKLILKNMYRLWRVYRYNLVHIYIIIYIYYYMRQPWHAEYAVYRLIWDYIHSSNIFKTIKLVSQCRFGLVLYYEQGKWVLSDCLFFFFCHKSIDHIQV
jgi:hypothetical protein